MPYYQPYSDRLGWAADLGAGLLDLVVDLAKSARHLFEIQDYGFKGGKTLRPGVETPLWNQLRRRLRPHLRKYGRQALLGRQLGLPRQRINAYVTGRTQMPDAERTLQILVWLIIEENARKRRRRRR